MARRAASITYCVLVAALVGALALSVACRRHPPFSGDWRELRHGQRGDRWGFGDSAGRWAIELRFVQYGRFSEGLAWAAEKGTATATSTRPGAS